MADALVERRPSARFFCHRCNVEFEDVLQDYTCPYCASGFIEQLESEAEGSALSGDDFSDADMSNLDDSDEMHQSASLPMLSDLAFLMSGGRHRGAGRAETLLESLVYSLGGAGVVGAAGAGAPFVLVGAPGDYVFGGEGLDAVVTQLLGQLESAGPPPLPRDQIAAIPSQPVTADQADAHASCSVCWDNFQLGEMVSRLQCDHIFHATCIEPWLQLHATCPICRRSLLPEEAAPAPAPAADAPSPGSAGKCLLLVFSWCDCIEPWLQLHFTCPICRRSLLPEEAALAPASAADAPSPGSAGKCLLLVFSWCDSIEPWLQLHATCPICRRSLLPEEAALAPAPAADAPSPGSAGKCLLLVFSWCDCIEPWLQLHFTCPICRRSLLPEEAALAPASAADAPSPGSAGKCLLLVFSWCDSIEPWLQLHATCPICRRSLLPEEAALAPAPAADAPSPGSAGKCLLLVFSWCVCIDPWLQLHATCPICRRSLLPEEAAPAANALSPRSVGGGAHVRLRRLARRRPWDSASSSDASVTSAGLWAPADSTSTSSLNSADRSEYNMDIDYD